MNYQLTEDEYADLHGVRCHLRFLHSLLEGRGSVECQTEELLCALASLREPIDRTLEAVDERQDLIRGDEGMNALHWHMLLGLVSGLAAYRWRDVLELDERLGRDGAVDPDMAVVHRLYRAAVTDNGRYQMVTRESTTLDFGVQFERPQPPASPAIDAKHVYELYGAEDADGVVAAIVATANHRYGTREEVANGQ